MSAALLAMLCIIAYSIGMGVMRAKRDDYQRRTEALREQTRRINLTLGNKAAREEERDA